MGDFAVDPVALHATHGPRVAKVALSALAEQVAKVSDALLDAEAAQDAARFDLSAVPPDVLRESNRVGLALRAVLESLGADAFSMNFQDFSRRRGTPTVPFLEASKAMARGVGYAGEGDVLTASFIAALMAGFGDATFTEMFCPDWQGNAIFMSHMGECNVAMAKERPRLVEKDYRFGNVCNPVIALMTLKPGPATLANVAPLGFGALSVTAARVEVLDRGLSPNFPDVPHFWIRPREGDIRDFLRRYSEAGGTHHLALLPGDHTDGLRLMAKMLSLEFTCL
jgi:L-arabinose isomerase